MRYLIKSYTIILGLVVSTPALPQMVCTQNGAAIVCNDGRVGNRVGNMIIWNNGNHSKVIQTAPRGIYGPSNPRNKPTYPANPSYGTPGGVYGQ